MKPAVLSLTRASSASMSTSDAERFLLSSRRVQSLEHQPHVYTMNSMKHRKPGMMKTSAVHFQ